MKYLSLLLQVLVICTVNSCKKEDPDQQLSNDPLQIISARVGTTDLNSDRETVDVPVDQPIVITFTHSIDTGIAATNLEISDIDSNKYNFTISYLNNYKTTSIRTDQPFNYYKSYIFKIKDGLKGTKGEKFKGITYQFRTQNGEMKISSITVDGKDFYSQKPIKNIPLQTAIEIKFSEPLERNSVQDNVKLYKSDGSIPVTINFLNNDSALSVTNNTKMEGYAKYYFNLSGKITSTDGHDFYGFNKDFFTMLDSTLKYPVITDDELLTKIQQQTFRYFWDFGHPYSGLTRERNTSGDIVTTGGSGFGIMALIVGIERGFITRTEGTGRLETILDFLEPADRFHGVWSHWMNGTTGETIPFSEKDNGGDLVETTFLIQGLLTFRQYLDPGNPDENQLINRINQLWESVEWDWYTRNEQVLYWHWSEDYGWEMNHKIRGYNETLITYILAAASSTHGIEASVYHDGYAQNGAIINGKEYYGYKLPLGYDYGGPLFFAHYSFLGLDPRNLEDSYANYMEQNVNHSLINQAYCSDNPKDWVGYSEVSWGLTASDNHQGYSAHSPTNDLGVITPTAGISSIPYTPVESLDAIRHFYYILGDKLWGEYGFYDAFNATEGWWANSYLAIDQGPILIMIENYRSALLWDLFMSCPEVQSGLTKLGFTCD